MRTPILAICSMLLLAPTICASETTSSSSPSANEYGIDPAASYPGTVVAELLRAAEEEAVAAVRDAFAQGYKDGRVNGAAIWKPLRDAALERAARAERRPTLRDVLLAGVTGILLGGASALAYGNLAR